jgi:hypothetical protein
VTAGAIAKAFILLTYYFYIKNIENMLENGLVLATGDRSNPLDKGKGKATDDESIYESLNKGKRKATDDESIYESLDKGKRRAIDYDSKDEGSSSSSSKDNQNNDSDSNPDPDSYSYSEPKSGSDIDSDPELNDEIQEAIDELKEKVKDKIDYKIYEEIDTLEQLLHYKYKRREPLPPVPDFWGHGYNKKPSVKKSTDEESIATSSGTSSSKLEEISSLPQGNQKNISENTPKNVTDVSVNPKSNESTNEKPKQTPTEYVHELESTEPQTYVWDDSD